MNYAPSEIVQEFGYSFAFEYLLDVDDKLSGTLDYFLVANQNLIIIEAKNKGYGWRI